VRFTLTYDGPLHIGNKAPGKQHVRAHLHPQVRQLWDFPPLAGDATAGMLTWLGCVKDHASYTDTLVTGPHQRSQAVPAATAAGTASPCPLTEGSPI